MYITATIHLLLLLLLLLGVADNAYGVALSSSCRKEPYCKIQKVHGLKAADCFRKDMKSIPRCVADDVDILDLTYNRIREVTANDLRKYSNLKFLYLGENMITKIDPNAFADKSLLQALDLSYNAFSHTIPDVIFQLPSLKNLYLSQNQNINIVEAIERAAPIKSPLVLLDISYNNYMEELDGAAQRLPDLGILPTLLKYNVSGMDLIMNFSDTAGLCNLEIFVTDNITASFAEDCDCWNMERWLRERKVRFTSFGCRNTGYVCNYVIPSADMETFATCKSQHAEFVKQQRINFYLIVVAATLGVIFLISVLLLWRWNRQRTKRRQLKNAILHNHLNKNSYGKSSSYSPYFRRGNNQQK